jgi:hypothetical protein
MADFPSDVRLEVGVLPLDQRTRWLACDVEPLHGSVVEDMLLSESLLLMDDTPAQRLRAVHSDALVKYGTLRKRLQYVIRDSQDRDPAAEGSDAGDAIGFSEVLLVRAPGKPAGLACRICLGDEDEDEDGDEDEIAEALIEEAIAAASASSYLHVGTTGRLLRDVCACRGSAACVHEGCLVAWQASSGWGEPRCPTCKQRFVGSAALMLARVAARVRDRAAAEAEARAAAAESEVGSAAVKLDAEVQAVQAIVAAHDEATAMWQQGRCSDAALATLTLLMQLPHSSPHRPVLAPLTTCEDPMAGTPTQPSSLSP